MCTSKNANGWYSFGVIAFMVCLVILVSGCESEQVPAPMTMVQSQTSLISDDTYAPIIGEQVVLRKLTPIFTNEPSELYKNMKVSYYGAAGKSFDVVEVNRDFLYVENSHGKVWIPSWYATDAVDNIQDEPLTRVVTKPNAKLSLFPMSDWRQLPLPEPLYVVFRWNDWLGVPSLPDPWYGDHNVYAPVLLWIHETDVDSAIQLEGGLWDKTPEFPITALRQITEIVLQRGVEQAVVERLLGKPAIVETSRNLNHTGDPFRLGIVWRYERADAHFTATFNGENMLEEWKWTLPQTHLDQPIRSGGEHQLPRNYEFRNLSITPSFDVSWTWRNKGPLAYTYLEVATDDILLIRGDDGGFSGMHYNSCLYAVDRETGSTLWQIDAGFGWLFTMMDEDRKHVIVYTPYDPVTKSYRQQVRRVRLSDGKVVWSYDSPHTNTMMAGAKGIVLLYNEPFESEGRIAAFDVRTGHFLWEKLFEKSFRIMNATGNEPFILLEQQNTLYALHPKTGKIQWNVSSNEPRSENEPYSRTYVEPKRSPLMDETYRWLALGNELVLLDVAKGNVRVRYPLRVNGTVHIVDEKYLLVQTAIDDPIFWNATQFETSLYDTTEKQSRWTIPGKAAGAVIEGDTVYLAVNGILTAVDLATGNIRWQSPAFDSGGHEVGYTVGARSSEPLLFSYGEDLMHINKTDGSIIGRMQDVLLGYADSRETLTRNGLVNRHGDSIYIGSANGSFSRLNVLELGAD